MKEQLKTAAKEFCEANKYNTEFLPVFMVQFAQSLIDKGVLVEADKWTKVENGLPENRSTVLVRHYNGYAVATYKHGCFFFNDGLEKINTVTDWKYILYMESLSSEKPTLSSAGKEVKTLQECKDDIAKAYMYNSWDDCISGMTSKEGIIIVGKRQDQAAELYASQFKSSPASTVKLISDEEIKNIVDEIHQQWTDSDGWTVYDALTEMVAKISEKLTGSGANSIFNASETEDLKQGLYFAIKALDKGNFADIALANRLELISKKLDDK